MKSWIVHLKNKYPGGKVFDTDSSVDVYDAKGDHVLALRKDGAGMWKDVSEEQGLSQRFCLAPIPKESRVFKLHKDGRIGKDEKAADREKSREKFLCKESGKVKSQAECEAEGMRFDRDGYVVA